MVFTPRFNDSGIPSVAYTGPEVVWVGLTEDQARKQGIKVKKGLLPWAASARAIANGRDGCVTKLLFDDSPQGAKYDKAWGLVTVPLCGLGNNVNPYMKGIFVKNWITLGMGCLVMVAFAGTELKNVPEPLGKSLGSHGTKSAAMEGGTLRVVLDKATLTELTYFTFIYHSICAEQWRSPGPFAKMGLKRVEVLNAAGTDGFAFDGDAATCADMGQMGRNFRTFISQYTTPCTSGRCGAILK